MSGGKILFYVKQSQINGIVGFLQYDGVTKIFVERDQKSNVAIFSMEPIIGLRIGTRNIGMLEFVMF